MPRPKGSKDSYKRRVRPKFVYTEAWGRQLLLGVQEGLRLRELEPLLDLDHSAIVGQIANRKNTITDPETGEQETLHDAYYRVRRGQAIKLLEETEQENDALLERLLSEEVDHKKASAFVSAVAQKTRMRQWLLEKLDRDKFGDKVEHTGKVDSGITVNIIKYDAPKAAIEGEVLRKELPHVKELTENGEDML